MPEVLLVIGGSAWGGWTGVRVQRGIEQIAGTFALKLTDRWPNQPSRRPIRPDDSCQVLIDGETVVAGFIDEVQIALDAQAHEVSVSGRDATGSLVDCSAMHTPGEWKERTLLQLAAALCEPFKIPVRAQADVGRPFASFSLQKGETAFEAIERACRHRAVLPVADSRGGLVLTRSRTGGRGGALIEGENVLSASAAFSHRERYGEYRVLGQAAGSDWTSPEDHAEPAASVRDPGVRRYRPLIVLAEAEGDGASFRDRALWEARVRAARARRADITVQGWRHAQGLWQPNTVAEVRCPSLGLAGDMLITSVEFNLDGRAGTTTALSLVPPDAFDLLPLPDKAEAGW